MKIIISPAKKMNTNIETCEFKSLPILLERTEEILRWIQQLTYAEAKKLWKCNDKLAELNYRRFQEMDLRANLTPAICSYEGLQYQYMAPQIFTEDSLDYVQKNLRILSGFYGILHPFDGVTPYRLEMQAKASIKGCKNLYEFWGDKLYLQVAGQKSAEKESAEKKPAGEKPADQENADRDRVIINLASKEYSKCIEDYLTAEDLFITCVFGEKSGGKIIQKGTRAKIARGEMVRFMAENNIKRAEEIKKFTRLEYAFSPADSTENKYVFLTSSSKEQNGLQISV